MAIALYSRWRRLGWLSKTGLLGAAYLALYTAFGFLVLPELAERVVVSRLGSALGRRVEVRDIDYNPYTHRLDVYGLAVRERDSNATFVSIARVGADVSLFSLVKLAGVMEEVSIVEPVVFIEHKGEGVYNFSDILAGAGDKPQAADKGGGQKSEAIFPFVVNNFHVNRGRVVFWDKSLDIYHSIEAINIRVPYTSSLPEDRQQPVEPSLSAIVNGKRLTLTGQTRPFADKLTTEFTFAVWGENLVPLWPYLPAPEGVDLARGLFSCSAVLAFERAEGILPRLAVRGTFNLDNVSLRGPDGQALAGFESLAVNLREFSLAQGLAALDSVALTVPYLHLTRLADGRLDWLALLDQGRDGDAPEAPASEPAEPGSKEPWPQAPPIRVTADKVEVASGFFRFTDKAVAPEFETLLAPIDLRVENLDTAPGVNATFVFTMGTADSVGAGARGAFSPVPPSAVAECNVTGVAFTSYRAYYEKLLPLKVEAGRARTGFTLALAPGGQPEVHGLDLVVSGVRLAKPKGGRALAFDTLAVENATILPADKRAEIGRVLLAGADLRVSRTPKGKIDLAELFAAKDKGSAPEPAKAEVADGPEQPFTVAVAEVALRDCKARFRDHAVPGPAEFALDKVRASLGKVRSDLAGSMPFSLAAVFQKTAKLAAKGRVQLKPGLMAEADVDVRGLPLAAGLPYLPQGLPAKPASGTLSAKGRARAAQGKALSFSYAGGLSLDNLLVRHADTGRRLAWLDRFSLEGAEVKGPGVSATADALALSGFRLEDMEQGMDMAGFSSLRLGGVAYSQTPPRAGVEAVDLDAPFALIVKRGNSTNVAATVAALRPKRGESRAAGAAEPPPEPERAEARESGPGAAPEPMDLSVGVARMRQGTFTFKDETVSPAFSVGLVNATARLDNLSLTPGRRAALSLNATFANQAPLLVEAGFDPTLSSLDSQVRVTVRNFSMSGLSPYTAKHVSHAIETGKLRADVRLDVKGQDLDGDNSIFIENFELGPDVDSPDDMGVPMGLAVALLRDMDGNVALDVPVSGNLSDPEFSLGGVIVGAIVNVITKIVTSPFAMLGGMLEGGGEEDSYLAFAPGSAALDPEARGKLDRLAEVMARRPGLKLEVAGYVQPETDGPAVERDMFTRMVKRRKYLELKEDGQAPAGVEDVVLSVEEYPEYLEEAYLESDAPKETNFLGMVEVPPVADMEAALKAGARAGKGELLELATDRAQAARSYLESRGVGPERLFIKYGTFDAPPEQEGAPPARVEFAVQ